jgi:hypothetical protein
MFSSNLRAAFYLAGRIAERRGRRFKNGAGIAAFIGPFALPPLFLFPNLQGQNLQGENLQGENLQDQNGDHAWGSKQGGPGPSVPALCSVDDRGRRLRRPYSAACLRVLSVGYSTCPQRKHSNVWRLESRSYPSTTIMPMSHAGQGRWPMGGFF